MHLVVEAVGVAERHDAAVADVDGRLAVAQITENVRPPLTGQCRLQLVQQYGELVVVIGVDGDELAGRAAVLLLAVGVLQAARVVEEFERDVVRHADPGGAHQGLLGIVRNGRHVDLPALDARRPVARRPALPTAPAPHQPAVGELLGLRGVAAEGGQQLGHRPAVAVVGGPLVAGQDVLGTNAHGRPPDRCDWVPFQRIVSGHREQSFGLGTGPWLMLLWPIGQRPPTPKISARLTIQGSLSSASAQ